MAQPVAEEAVQENLLAGRNPIREALKAGRDIEKLLVQKGELTALRAKSCRWRKKRTSRCRKWSINA